MKNIAWFLSGVFDFDSQCKKLEMNPLQVLHGEQEFEYLGDIYPGEIKTAIDERS